jgi:hypothetical protein
MLGNRLFHVGRYCVSLLPLLRNFRETTQCNLYRLMTRACSTCYMSIRMSNFYFFLLIVVVVVFFFLKKNYFPGMFACGFCKTASVLDVWEKIHL